MKGVNGQNKIHRFTSDPCKPPTMLVTVFQLSIGFHPNDKNPLCRLTNGLKYIYFRQQVEKRMKVLLSDIDLLITLWADDSI